MIDPEAHLSATTLPAGCVSFVDRDWTASIGDPTPAISFSSDGDVLWCGQRRARIAAGIETARAAAGALLAVAREAEAALPASVRPSVEVIGQGLVAACVRRLLEPVERDPATPRAVVDTTGDPDTIRRALERVAELGTVVVAGESAGRTFDLDMYSTIHGRGLVLVGIAPPLHGVEVLGSPEASEADLAFCLGALAEGLPATPGAADALWYRIVT